MVLYMTEFPSYLHFYQHLTYWISLTVHCIKNLCLNKLAKTDKLCHSFSFILGNIFTVKKKKTQTKQEVQKYIVGEVWELVKRLQNYMHQCPVFIQMWGTYLQESKQGGLFGRLAYFFSPQNPEYQIFNALKPQEELLLKLDTARNF